MAQDVRLCLGIQFEKRNQFKKCYSLQDMIKWSFEFKFWIVQIWKDQKLKLNMLLDVGSQYENVGKIITRLKITDQIIQHSIESS